MHEFEAKLAASWPPATWQDHTVLLAVSGGADSVALLRAMRRLKVDGVGRLIVAHFDHAVRGSESSADREFVMALCGQLNIEVRIGERDRETLSIAEESLRTARYEFLQATAERVGARQIATAHTADDQIETILHRIIRGTGIGGLAGVPRTRPLGEAVTIIRPMLAIHRHEVLQYLAWLNQPFREDASNRDTTYTRNRIRHELIPLLARDYNPQVADAILRLGTLAADAQAILDHTVVGLIESRVRIDTNTCIIDCSQFVRNDRQLVRELLTALWRQQQWPLGEMGFTEWNQLAEIALSEQPQSQDLPGSIRAQKKGASLTLTRLV